MENKSFASGHVKFLKKREQLVRRSQAQLSNFLSQYRSFGYRFQFKGQHLNDYLQEELNRVRQLTGLGEQYVDGAICAASSHVDDKESNARKVVNPPRGSAFGSRRGSVASKRMEASFAREREKLVSAGAPPHLGEDSPYL